MATDINDLAKQYILPGVLKNQNTTPSSPGVPNATPDWMQQAAGYTPPVSPQQPQQQSSGRSILGSVGHGIGEALHVGNEVLGASQKYLARPILGAVTRAEVSDPVWKIIGPHSNISEEQRNQIRAAQSFTQAYRERAKHISAGGQMALEIVADPTTWITAGGVDALTGTKRVSDLIERSPEAARVFMGARQAVGGFQEAQALPLTGPLKLAKVGLTKGPVAKLLPDALKESDTSLAQKAIKGASAALFNAAQRGAETVGTDTGKNILGDEIQRGLTFKNLVGSKATEDANRVVTTLNLAPKPERVRLLTNMRAPERDAVIKSITPNDASATDVVEFFKSQGILQDNVIADTHTAAGKLKNRVTDLNNLAPDIQGKIKFVTDRAATGDIAQVTATIDNDMTQAARHALFETVKSNPSLDPNGSIMQHLVSRGEAELVPGSTTLIRTPAFETSLKRTTQKGAFQPKNSLPPLSRNIEDNIDNALTRLRQNVNNTIQTMTPFEGFVSDALKQAAQKNPDHFGSQTLFLNAKIAEPLTLALSASTEKEARTYLAIAFSRMNMHNSAFGVMHPIVARNWEKFIPRIQQTADKAVPIVTAGVHNAVLSDRDMSLLTQMFESQKVQNLQKVYETMHGEVSAIMDKYALTKMTDNTTAGDMWNAIDKGLITDNADQKVVEKFLTKFDMTPEAAARYSGSKKLNRLAGLTDTDLEKYTIREAYMDKAIEAWAHEVKAFYKIDDKISPSIFAGLAWIPRAWREQALVSPRYHLANWMDMVTRGLLYGVNPVRASAGADHQAGVWGTTVPQDLLLGRNNARNIGNLSNLPEFIGQQPNTALGDIPIAGRVLEPIVRLNRAVARSSENTVRKWAWNNGAKDYLTTFRPEFDGHLRRLLPGNQAADIIEALNRTGDDWARNEGVHFSPQQVYDLIMQRGGSNTASANELMGIWQTAVDNASHAGTEFANKVQLDFDTTYNIEDKLMLKKFLPFHFFATRNIPFYLETLAAHPEMVNAWQAFQDTSEQDRIAMGLPSRYRNYLPGPSNGLLDMLLGPGQIFFNPMAAVSLFDQAKTLQQDRYEQPGTEHGLISRATIGDIADLGGKVGLSVAPWVQIPMSMAGFYGPADEPMPIFRWSSLVEDTTGHDFFGENIARSVENKVRETTTGKSVPTFTGSQMRDNQIVSRIQEDMFEAITQNPNLPPDQLRQAYIQASKDGPGNPIWDTAAESVRKDRVHTDIRGLVDPLPTKVVQKDRLAIQEDQNRFYSDVPAELQNNQTFMNLLRNNPQTSASAAVQGFHRPKVQDAGTAGSSDTPNPSAIWLDWGGDIWGPGKPPPFGSRPMYETYKDWFFQQPDKSVATPQAFLHAFVTGP